MQEQGGSMLPTSMVEGAGGSWWTGRDQRRVRIRVRGMVEEALAMITAHITLGFRELYCLKLG